MPETVHRCRCDRSIQPGIRDGQLYEKLCVGQHVHTLQSLVTYRGVNGPDAGLHFHTTLSHWEQIFEEIVGASEQ